MNDELFETPEHKSPRLQWMDKHAISISFVGGAWKASASGKVAISADRDEALGMLAQRMGISSWSEDFKPFSNVE